ncbi:MAG: hypothetical protein AAF570_21070, partial [Bacteroidota bacterium]
MSFLLFVCLFHPLFAQNANLDVMKLGLGEGVIEVTGTNTAINCGVLCGAQFDTKNSLRFKVTYDKSKYKFAGWRGAFKSQKEDTTVKLSGNAAVTATFELKAKINTINDYFPGEKGKLTGIEKFLKDNPDIKTPAHFLAALRPEYRRNWILMSRSESLQTGTAKYPRILLPSADARFVFTIGVAPHS